MTVPVLSTEELARYQRQIIFPALGLHGQERLKQTRVLVVGAGGLGSSVLNYLVAAGIGQVMVVDHDEVEVSNLNRQILHWESDLGLPKVESALNKLKALNPWVNIQVGRERLTPGNAGKWVNGVDLVLDCLDNLPSRLVLNRACFEAGIPMIHGGVQGMRGQVSTFVPGETGCLECLFKDEAPPSTPTPVFGATASVVGSVQVLEAIKYLCRFGRSLCGKLLIMDFLGLDFRMLDIGQREDCPVCSSL